MADGIEMNGTKDYTQFAGGSKIGARQGERGGFDSAPGNKLQQSLSSAKFFAMPPRRKSSASNTALPVDRFSTIEEIFMKRLITPRALAAILVLSSGLAAGSSFAGDHHGKWFGGTPAVASIFHGRAFARLHDELKLDAQQEALWKEAGAFAREQRDAMRARLAEDHAEIKALLERPESDLRAVAQRADELRAEGMKLRDAVRERWFAVYDALGAKQKETVRQFFKDGAARLDGFGERGRERERFGRGHARRGPRQTQ
jgi:Spy/CpxP family protein refolding chaperone